MNRYMDNSNFVLFTQEKFMIFYISSQWVGYFSYRL